MAEDALCAHRSYRRRARGMGTLPVGRSLTVCPDRSSPPLREAPPGVRKVSPGQPPSVWKTARMVKEGASRPRSARMSGQERREQLVAVGRQVFAQKGFEASSVEEIAARAKVSKPIVYEHFGGKEGLYDKYSLCSFDYD